MNPPPRCGNCAYFAPYESVGQCRRHAPLAQATSGSGDLTVAWPIVLVDDWCGEFVRTNTPNPPASRRL